MEVDLDDVLKSVTDELFELYIPTEVETVQKPVSPSQILSFHRKYVQKNVPVKITGKSLLNLYGLRTGKTCVLTVIFLIRFNVLSHYACAPCFTNCKTAFIDCIDDMSALTDCLLRLY